MLTLSKQEVRAYTALNVLLLLSLAVVYAFRAQPEPLALPAYTGRASTTEAAQPLLVELNLAQPHDLMQIKGFGPKTVQSIMYCRKCLGGFSDKRQLLRIPGIGETTLEKVDSFLLLSPLGAHIWAPMPPYAPTVTQDLNRIENADLQRTCLLDKQLAKRLIQRRDSRNGFRSWSEVAGVEGIGWENVRALQRHFHLKPPGLISLNASTKADWEQLPGVGPKTAENIFAYREQLGGFHSVDQLDEVRGIGPKTLEKLNGRLQSAAAPEELRGIDVMTLDSKQLSRHPYITVDQAAGIIQLREANKLSINGLEESKLFSKRELKRLQPYLNVPVE